MKCTRVFTPLLGVVLGVNVLLLALSFLYYGATRNYEFIAYTALLAVFVLCLYATLPYTKFPASLIIAFSLWGGAHMLGGSVLFGEEAFYAYRLYPFFDGGGEFFILKFDQVVHAYIYGVVALMVLHLLRIKARVTTRPFLISVMAVAAAAGIGTLNEIVEFFAVVLLEHTGVGGYFNTLLDLIFNLAGAVLAVLCYWGAAHLRRRT